MSICSTGSSIGSAPASSIVLKKIGAILEPRQTPPKRLFGTNGMSSPVKPQHRVGRRLARGTGTDHVADVGDQVALGLASASSCLTGPRAPGSSASMPDAGSSAWPARAAGCPDATRHQGRRQVVGVGFAGDLEHGQLLRGRHFRTLVNHSASAQTAARPLALALPFQPAP